MSQVLKKYLIWAVLGAAFYGLLSYHFIIIGHSVNLLKKSELSLNYTFYSTNGKRNRTMMAIDELRDDGIGELLMEKGRMSEAEYNKYMEKYAYEEEDDY